MSMQSMRTQPNSCRRNAVDDEPPRALSQDSGEKGNFQKEEGVVHVTNCIFIEVKLHDLSQPC